MNIDWSKAPEGAIGAFSKEDGDIFFVKTKEPSEYMNRPGYCGIQCDYNGYHVFTKYWTWHERPASWNDEGLPPVGTRCVFDGEEGEIVAHVISNSKSSAIIQLDDDWWPADAEELSPLRTPEQIAAEERESEVQHVINQMAQAAGAQSYSDEQVAIIERLARAGYRKQEQTK